jgi:hypothetical protein
LADSRWACWALLEQKWIPVSWHPCVNILTLSLP